MWKMEFITMRQRILFALCLFVVTLALAGMMTACGALGPTSPDVTVIVGNENETDNDTDNDTTSGDTTTDTVSEPTVVAE